MPRFHIWITPALLGGLLGGCASMPVQTAPYETLPPLAAETTAIADIQATNTTYKPVAMASVSVAAIPAARKVPPPRAGRRDWRVRDVRVAVPEDLRASESNALIPNADIVWNEGPYGDRRQQVARIVDLAASQAALGLDGGREVYLDITLRRFHALSRKARATVGGWHNIHMDVAVRDAVSGETLVARRAVNLRFPAFGGQRAIEAEMQGITQKRRISEAITRALAEYLRG